MLPASFRPFAHKISVILVNISSAYRPSVSSLFETISGSPTLMTLLLTIYRQGIISNFIQVDDKIQSII